MRRREGRVHVGKTDRYIWTLALTFLMSGPETSCCTKTATLVTPRVRRSMRLLARRKAAILTSAAAAGGVCRDPSCRSQSLGGRTGERWRAAVAPSLGPASKRRLTLASLGHSLFRLFLTQCPWPQGLLRKGAAGSEAGRLCGQEKERRKGGKRGEKKESHIWGLNPGPLVYKTNALPLC